MRTAITPFSRVNDDDIRFIRQWHVRQDGLEKPLGACIEVWDFMTELELSAGLDIQIDSVRASTHQGANSAFGLVVSASSSTTRLRGPVWKSDPLRGESVREVGVEVRLAGFELGGRLDLLTSLVLVEPDPISEIGAISKGSILWQNRHQTFLEGHGPQFPTEGADFSIAPYDIPRAGWRLEFDLDDLDSAAGGAIRLLVNDNDPLMTAVRQGIDSPEVAMAIRTMRWDVARQLIWACLDSDEFIERYGSFAEDSVGWVLTNILNQHFAGDAPSSLRAIRDSSRPDFESRLQHAAGLVG
jgi:hypothetical protein